MVDLLSLPTITTVVVSALVDSINPCAIGVLILLLSLLTALSYNRSRMIVIGMAYIFSIFAVYLVAGLGLSAVLSKIPIMFAVYLSLLVALIVVGAGLVEIKDFFWYGQGFSLAIPPKKAKQIEHYARKSSIPGVMFLGAFVAGVELPCTGAPYLVIIMILSQNFNFSALMLMILYNFLFVLPLLVILFSVAFGHKKLHEVKRWKQSYRKYMRLAAGILMIALGVLLMLLANGTINLG